METPSTLVQVGTKGRMTLTGHADELFMRQDFPDGSILLQPAVVKSQAQEEYDTNPELQDLLRKSASAPTWYRTLTRRALTHPAK